jgi:phosphatidylserine/phosphatidylglycerophosphate/cardiolipin synthase-like enzyme
VLLNTVAAEWLFDDQYISFVRACINAARHQILVQQFLVDPRPEEDQQGQVRYLLHALAEAAHRALDVRVLLAQVIVERPLPIDINEPAARFLIRRGVKVRHYPLSIGRQMHAKVILVDDELVIAGSHNWTPKAFRVNSETSMVIKSADSAASVKERFTTLWSQSEDYESH